MSILLGAPGDSVLVFDVGVPTRRGQAVLGLDVRHVQRVIEIDGVESVPLAPLVVRGIINDKGRIVTLVDPSPLLQLGQQSAPPIHGIILKQTGQKQGAVGLLARRVRGIVPGVELSVVDIDTGPCTGRVLKLGPRLVHVIDVELLHKELRGTFVPSAGGETRQGEPI